MSRLATLAVAILALLLTWPYGCSVAPNSSRGVPPSTQAAPLKVLATTTFLADIAQNVAGSRLKVDSLLPVGVEPHSFEPTPGDVAKVADSDLIIANGTGLEKGYLDRLLGNAGGSHTVVEASAGLASRTAHPGEMTDADPEGQPDPHFWLDPNLVLKYVENIRNALSGADPEGAQTYADNAQAYSTQLKELDEWIAEQVQQVPPEQRLLVTDHESLGYYADRYGFEIVGAVIPSLSTEASPSAQQLVDLLSRIKASGAKAIFLETRASPQLAHQVAKEAGVKVVADLYAASLSEPSGPAPSYLAMMRHNTRMIVEALK